MAYSDKFSDFIRMCKEAKEKNVDVVVVAEPIVLGDTHAELIESLSRLAESGLHLAVASPATRRLP